MTLKDLDIIGKRIEDLVPAVKKFEPVGFVDFRKGIPPSYCSGILAETQPAFPNVEGRGMTGRVMIKYGSKELAENAARLLSAYASIEAKVVAPYVDVLESEGEEYRIRNDFWTVQFSVTEQSAIQPESVVLPEHLL